MPDQTAPHIVCTDVRNSRFVVYVSRTPPAAGRLVITQVIGDAIVLPEIPGIPVDFESLPDISLAFESGAGFGLLITGNGGLVAHQADPAHPYGVYFPVGQCQIQDIDVSSHEMANTTQLGNTEPPPDPLVAKYGELSAKGANGQHLPLNATESQALACESRYGVNDTTFLTCMRDAMLSEPQRAAVACVSDPDANKYAAIACLAKVIDPRLAETVDTLQNCRDANDLNREQGGEDWECVLKSRVGARQFAAYECARNAADDKEKAKAEPCIAALGLTGDEAKIATAIANCSQISNTTSLATCVLNQSGNKHIADAGRCLQEQVESSEFSYTGAALCYGASQVNMNMQWQIAVECAAESGGAAYAYVGCVAGRLTVAELERCFTNGVGGDSGCFGKNNTIVRAVRAVGGDVGRLANPDGETVRMWRIATSDVITGPGPNNDIARFARYLRSQIAAASPVLGIPLPTGPNNPVAVAARQADRGVRNANDQVNRFMKDFWHGFR